MKVSIVRILTTITGQHDIKIGGNQFVITPGTNNINLAVDPDAPVLAKLPHEYDWFNYGTAREYIHKTSLGYELRLFASNKEPIVDFNTHSSSNNILNPRKKNKNWW